MSKKPNPWIPLDVGSWELITDLFPPVWSEWAVYQDLRYWDNSERMGWKKMPSRRRLQSRWGWSDWNTRQALKSEDKWRTSQLPPKDLPTTSQKPPKNSTQIPEIRKEILPTTSQLPPNYLPTPSTRAELNNQQQTTKKKEDNKTLLSVWDDINAIKGGRPLKLSKVRKKTLKARLSEHSPQELLQVVGWWHESKHSRAEYLRENGHGIDTLFRASKFESYLEMSYQQTVIASTKPKKNWGGDFFDELMSETSSDILTITTQPTTEDLEHVAQ